MPYTEHTYDYVDHGGAGEAARQLGLDPHAVVKTLVMEDESAKPLIVVIEVALMLSIATTLALLVAGPPERAPR